MKRLTLKAEVQERRMELEGAVKPIMRKLYRAAGRGSEPEAHGSERKRKNSIGNCCFTARALAEDARLSERCGQSAVNEKAEQDMSDQLDMHQSAEEN
eukprot:8009154-Alexandrium_andersonii.AAC.1